MSETPKKITFANKQPGVAAPEGVWRAQDANEVKEAINENADYFEDKASLLSDRIDTVEDAQGAGVIGYADKATMDADTTQDEGALALVTNDTTSANNGYYRWDGSAWVESDYFGDDVFLFTNSLTTTNEIWSV